MTRPMVALLHAGYWSLYGLLLVVVLFILRAPHHGPRPRRDRDGPPALISGNLALTG